MFFGTLTISYDAWMMSHTKIKKLFLRFKIGPKVIFSPKSLLALCNSNKEGFKERPCFCYGGGNDLHLEDLKMQYFWNGGSDDDQSCIGAHSGPIRPFLD